MLYRRDYQKPFWRGLLHAFFIGFYAVFLAIILLSLKKLFAGDIGLVIRLAFGIFLGILSFGLCGYLLFYEPLALIMHHHFKAATIMLVSTLGWLLIFLVVFLIGLVYTIGAAA